MAIIPYTRARWRVMGAIAFILTAWWVYSWAWYSISGLLIADAVMNMGLGTDGAGSAFTVRKVRIPFWSLGALFMAAGFIMQFVWTAARPDLQNAELYYHTGIYSTGYFLLQSIIIYAIGIRIVTNMAGDDLSGYSRATGVALIVSLLVTVLAAEAMYWLVEVPSKWLGRRLFNWIRE
jgi:hypothetical protein